MSSFLAPLRVARAGGGAESAEPAETPNFSEHTSGVQAGTTDATTKARSTKSRKAPVSARGTFSHSIPIQVPPGRVGLTPSLALTYDSGSVAESAVGVGWSFGTASIGRSTRLGFPKVAGPDNARTYDDSAAIFTSPSGELAPASDGPGSAGTRFAPVRESSPVRYERVTTGGQDGWIEHEPSGRKRYYGLVSQTAAPQARIRNELGTTSWLLVRERDPFGNVIDYEYWNEPSGTASSARPDRKIAQRMPVLKKVSWGAAAAGVAQPFVVETTVTGQSGPLDLLNGTTILEDKIAAIIVKIDGAEKWRYALNYTTSATGKQLLWTVVRSATGETSITTTLTYSNGAVWWQDMGPLAAESRFDTMYTDNSEWLQQNQFEGLYKAAVSNPVRAIQSPGFRSGLKLLDVDGNGTTDAIYLASGVGNTESHVLWTESALQAPGTTGLGTWTAPLLGNPSAASVQPQTGLPFFPILTNDDWVPMWNRADIGAAALRDLVDIDGDGDADGVGFPLNANIRPGHNVALPGLPPPISGPAVANGTALLRVHTNHALPAGVTFASEHLLTNWPPDMPSQTVITATSTAPAGTPGVHPLQFKAEPASDLSFPAVDLNADGKTDFVLLKRRSPFFNYRPAGSLWGYDRAVTAPPNSILRIYYSDDDNNPALGELISGQIEDEIHHLVIDEHALVVAADDLFTSTQRPETWVRYQSNAGRFRIHELEPNIPVYVMSRVGDIPTPTVPGKPPVPDPDSDFLPPTPPDLPWWWPRVDPDGDVFVPLRDSYHIKGDSFGSRLLFGEFRFVPRAYMQRGTTTRSFVSEADETGSQFERSLRSLLNPGYVNECNWLSGACRYLTHVNFNSFLADVNGDSLPDLVVAVAPLRWSDSKGPLTTCWDNHRVFLNRGYGFAAEEAEAGTSANWAPTTPGAPLSRVANRDRFCHSTRPYVDDASRRFGTAPPDFPSAAMAQVDINGDGRLDLVFAYQPSVSSETVTQAVYVNTGRGFTLSSIPIPFDVALARNIPFPLQAQASTGLPVWPRAGLTDMSRFVDLDNDGLVDIVRAGMCRNLTPAHWPTQPPRQCRSAKWYRNTGELPDRLQRIDVTGGAWTTVEYAPPKSSNLVIPEGGQRPPASARLVKTVRSGAGPSDQPFDFPTEEIRLSYENYVKDLVSNEVLGFEKVRAEFVNAFNNLTEGSVVVTRTFDVQPDVLDGTGTLLPVRHPLKGALLSTVTESDGWTASEITEYSAEPLGTGGVRIRPRRSIRGDISPTATSAWTAEEILAFDAYGNPTEELEGNWDGASIAPLDHARRSMTEYDASPSRIAAWQIGLVTRERAFGYAEDIAGTPQPGQLLGETTKTYFASGAVLASTRKGIRGGTCAGADDDTTMFEYLAHGGVNKVTESNGRVTNTTYEAKGIYPSNVSTTFRAYVDGAPNGSSTTTLTAGFTTDLRHGKKLSITDANSKTVTFTYDSTGRLKTKVGPAPGLVTLESHVYADMFPVSQTSTLTTDTGKTFTRKTQLDAEGNVLSVVEGNATLGVPWSRTDKTRFDAWGRARESFHAAIVSSLDGGSAPSSGPKDVTTYDGFDRVTHVLRADGTSVSTAFEPREVTETDARGIPTKRTFDAFGDLVSVERNVGGAPSETSTHSFVRDGRGEILQVLDGDGSVRRFERDGGGRLLRLTLPTMPGNPETQFSMCHDLDDGLVRLESAAGRVVDITRDQLGRVVKNSGSDPSGLVVESKQTYDNAAVTNGKGRLTKKVDESGTYNLAYDEYGRPSSVSFAPSVRAKAGATNIAATYSAAFVYSPAGQLKTATITGLPQSAGLVYTRDAKGRATMVESKVGTSSKVLAVDLAYDADDRLTFTRYGNNAVGQWTFNPLTARLDRIDYKTAGGAVLAAVGYVYDPSGNPLEENREREGWPGVYSFKLHSYDALDRLLQSISSSPAGYFVDDHTFSPGGNLLTAGGDAYTYASGVTSQAATQVVNATAGTQRDLSYDLDGYLASDSHVLADGSTSNRTLAFDPMGCMRRIARTDAPLVGPEQLSSSDYTCGLDGKVVARATTKPDGSTSRRIDFAGLGEFRADEGVFVMRVPVGGSVAVEDARSLANGNRVTALSGYVANDLRGSVLATMAFGTENTAKEAEFDAWGKKLADFSTMSSPRHGFVGAEADEAVGSYSFGARTYDPTLRRWVSPDPLLAGLPGRDAFTGNNLNLFAYVGGNPTRRVDLTGFEEDDGPVDRFQKWWILDGYG
ncbi:MAG: VCBS repeat-containing protein [Deltaproteobacteria bacterium]|nr:VCBS repeat-containing protein [Deltaproteobacteria bacterium]